jgi:3-deoxy-manno-octulosonate cytidylyltransferase (CMP-KDO synthetase)
MQCIDFTRHDWESDYTHLGVYAFRRSVLKQFSQWPQTQREQSESLEQLRMMDRNIFIAGVLLGKETFISVDTPADLQRARAYGV